jgi:hypothetical protein
MAVTTTKTNKPLNPRGNDQSPKGYNRAALYSGKALSFDGVNDYVSVSYTEGIGSVWSWVSIIEFDSVSGYQELFGGQYGSTNATIYLKNTQLDFYTSGDNLNTDFDFETGTKYHIACSQSGDTISVYVNGQAAGSVSLTAQLNRSNGAYTIGKHPVNSNEYLNGKMSGVKLFNTALTPAQVSDLYNNPEKIVPTGVADSALKLWLPMMEGAGTTAYDGSGNGNHGTISGATWTHGVGSPVAQSAVIDWNKGTNLVPYSEELDEWSTTSLSVAQSTATAPDGSTNAYTLTDSNNTTYGICFPSSTISMSGDYVGSVFIKKTTGSITNYPGLDIAQRGSYLIIDTTNGTSVESGSGSNYSDVTITSYNDDWWRVSAKVNYSNTARPMRLWPAISSNGTSISASATGSATFWGAQVESADSLGAYIPTLSTAQTSDVLLPQGLTTGRDITGVNLFENVRKQGALNLDGNSRVSVHENASIDLSDCSLEAWVCPLPESDSGWTTIFSKVSQANLQIYLDAADLLSHYNTATAGGVLYSTAFNKNEWHHIVCVEDGTDVLTYVDGVLRTTKTISLQMDSDGDFSIGSKPGVLADEITAQIAQPRIYNRALTAEEVLQNYNSEKSIYQ